MARPPPRHTHIHPRVTFISSVVLIFSVIEKARQLPAIWSRTAEHLCEEAETSGGCPLDSLICLAQELCLLFSLIYFLKILWAYFSHIAAACCCFYVSSLLGPFFARSFFFKYIYIPRVMWHWHRINTYHFLDVDDTCDVFVNRAFSAT